MRYRSVARRRTASYLASAITAEPFHPLKKGGKIIFLRPTLSGDPSLLLYEQRTPCG